MEYCGRVADKTSVWTKEGNRIFESLLYDLFISEEFAASKMYDAGMQEKNQFIIGGHLDVRKVLEMFVETFHYLYGDADETRMTFLLRIQTIFVGMACSPTVTFMMSCRFYYLLIYDTIQIRKGVIV